MQLEFMSPTETALNTTAASVEASLNNLMSMDVDPITGDLLEGKRDYSDGAPGFTSPVKQRRGPPGRTSSSKKQSKYLRTKYD